MGPHPYRKQLLATIASTPATARATVVTATIAATIKTKAAATTAKTTTAAAELPLNLH